MAKRKKKAKAEPSKLSFEQTLWATADCISLQPSYGHQ
jgi:hypothetical protein